MTNIQKRKSTTQQEVRSIIYNIGGGLLLFVLSNIMNAYASRYDDLEFIQYVQFTNYGGYFFLIVGIWKAGKVAYTYYKKSATLDADNQAIAEDPKNPDSYYKRAREWRARNEPDKAIADLTKVIELDPHHLSARYDRAALYLTKAAWGKALEDYNAVIKLAPYKANVYNNRAVVYENMHESKKALADYEKALSLDPDKSLYKQNVARLKANSSYAIVRS